MNVSVGMLLIAGIKRVVASKVGQMLGVFIGVYDVSVPLLQFAHHLRIYLAVVVEEVGSLIDIDGQMK